MARGLAQPAIHRPAAVETTARARHREPSRAHTPVPRRQTAAPVPTTRERLVSAFDTRSTTLDGAGDLALGHHPDPRGVRHPGDEDGRGAAAPWTNRGRILRQAVGGTGATSARTPRSGPRPGRRARTAPASHAPPTARTVRAPATGRAGARRDVNPRHQPERLRAGHPHALGRLGGESTRRESAPRLTDAPTRAPPAPNGPQSDASPGGTTAKTLRTTDAREAPPAAGVGGGQGGLASPLLLDSSPTLGEPAPRSARALAGVNGPRVSDALERAQERALAVGMSLQREFTHDLEVTARPETARPPAGTTAADTPPAAAAAHDLAPGGPAATALVREQVQSLLQSASLQEDALGPTPAERAADAAAARTTTAPAATTAVEGALDAAVASAPVAPTALAAEGAALAARPVRFARREQESSPDLTAATDARRQRSRSDDVASRLVAATAAFGGQLVGVALGANPRLTATALSAKAAIALVAAVDADVLRKRLHLHRRSIHRRSAAAIGGGAVRPSSLAAGLVSAGRG